MRILLIGLLKHLSDICVLFNPTSCYMNNVLVFECMVQQSGLAITTTTKLPAHSIADMVRNLLLCVTRCHCQNLERTLCLDGETYH